MWELDYLAGGNSLSSLTYSYDSAGRVVGKGGSLAAVNLPNAVGGNAYSTTNQINTWNGVSATFDHANNLTLDPSSGYQYTWDERNQLSQAGAYYWYYYDALSRLETFDNDGVDYSYLYDGALVVQLTQGGAASGALGIAPDSRRRRAQRT